MTFRVGQKVVCIDDRKKDTRCWPIMVVCGQVYTIRSMRDDPLGNAGLLLEEVASAGPTFRDGSERGFNASRFRLLIEKSTETGMAILRKVADDARNKGKVTVKA